MALIETNTLPEDRIKPVPTVASNNGSSSMRRRRRFSGDDGPQMSGARSIDRVAAVAASLLILGSQTTRPLSAPSVSKQQQPALNDVPFLSRQATIGRNSQFHNLTTRDRELLGGIEYRSLKLLLKIVTGESSQPKKENGAHSC